MKTTDWSLAWLASLGVGLLLCGCSGDDGAAEDSDGSTGTDSAGAGTDSGGTAGDATSSGGSSATSGTTDGATDSSGAGGAGGTTALDPEELCGGPCACSNGVDDDGDGKVDGFDEECTGAADDDEGTFATGIAGDNVDPKWQDCFFDGNSGAGDDGCRYHTDCLTGALPADHESCTVTQACVDFCVERTPSGCDCFGCCTFETSDGPRSVQIGTSCDFEDIENEELCPPCTPTAQCDNECGECELCPGKEELPETCEEETPECDLGRTACDQETLCPPGEWCQLGCCVIQPIN